ncbi:hypothetical protein [Prochlorococcus marinus]|uniref:hypothetical protein n=1 Tax=Prochlorococcus marinus TaxID=1219 RepID=UPI001ADC0DAD|nr:hypothetical protein [Prochlorococcus marinus]MBO8217699.1 hypothetical protein [Prochlorococcus marinus XMU1405]MBW3040862.1 hypothetical protein [Prochlorococcus marinus str. MU1405]MBW3048322.1 hypothetical protein [Prochlorococcus marinus str. MU1406]
MKRKLFIVAKEVTIPIAAAVYDVILKEENKFKPEILLITPVEEIISNSLIKKYFKGRRYISCWRSVRNIIEKNNSINELKKFDPNTFKLILNELCAEPNQLFDLNRRIQNKNNSPELQKFVLCSQAIYFHNILENNKESLIIDFDVYDVSRTILLSVSNFYGIEYRSVIRSRFDNYYLRTNELGKNLANKMYSLKIENEYFSQAKNELKKFRSSKDITSEVEKTVLIPKFSLKASFSLLKSILIYLYLMIYRVFIGNLKFYKYPLTKKYKKYIIGNTVPSHINNILVLIRNLFRIWEPFKALDALPINYIYFPMPNTVENSETRFNGNILSERLVIDLFRPSIGLIPMICKDHRSMIQDRTTDFIRETSMINNIIYLSEWTHKWNIVNPLNLLKNSLLNITIAGTAGLESAMLGKSTLILGNPIYGEFFKVSGFNLFNMEEISEALKNDNFISENFVVDEKIIIHYLAATISLGKKINLFFLIKDPFNKKYKNEIIKLTNFLIK